MDNHEEAREFTDGSSVLPSNVCLCLSVFIYPPLHSGPSRGLSSKDPSPLLSRCCAPVSGSRAATNPGCCEARFTCQELQWCMVCPSACPRCSVSSTALISRYWRKVNVDCSNSRLGTNRRMANNRSAHGDAQLAGIEALDRVGTTALRSNHHAGR